MQTDNRLLDDLSRVATGAFSALTGVREEVESRMREQFEKVLARMDMVTREEFDAVQAMASRARAEQEALALRIAALESQLAELTATAADKAPGGAKAAATRAKKAPDAS
ncbi:MAG TPA: accessory factor UbiK family protein [Aliidongia sp.]|nr:accessory factor UbiK family protein [Aliidongia sp.]